MYCIDGLASVWSRKICMSSSFYSHILQAVNSEPVLKYQIQVEESFHNSLKDMTTSDCEDLLLCRVFFSAALTPVSEYCGIFSQLLYFERNAVYLFFDTTHLSDALLILQIFQLIHCLAALAALTRVSIFED